jgi:hypothetical protein
MKRRFASLLLVYSALASVCAAQKVQRVNYAAALKTLDRPSDRLFFPKNFVRGFTQFEYFPSHNEPDLGRCRRDAANFGGANDPCAAFGRYSMGGYLELQIFGRRAGPLPLNKVFLYIEPRAYFGSNVPQFNYTQSFAPIAVERNVGLIVELRRNLQLRMWQHRNQWLGRYEHNLGGADLGPSGPLGLHAGVALRWSFGGWGRDH